MAEQIRTHSAVAKSPTLVPSTHGGLSLTLVPGDLTPS